MRRALFLLPLLMGGCSCQPDSARVAADPAAATEPSTPAAAPSTAAGAALDGTAPSSLNAVADGARSEGETVRDYVRVLLSESRAASDAYWRGGRTSSSPDDQALRHLPPLTSLKVVTELPVARDTGEPSRLREVPVLVRAGTVEGTFLFKGWYRLEPRVDGSGWELTGASLQPVLH